MNKKQNLLIHLVPNFIITIMLSLITIATFGLNSINVFNSNKLKAIYAGNKDSSYVSLMFNVYWGNEYIDDILTTLKKYKIKTTFFVGGTWAEKNQTYLNKIYKDGHEIANHGYFHKNQDKLNYDENYSEINSNHQLIKNLLNIEMNLFAPPSGAYNNSTLEVANMLGYKTIMWSKDTIDWRDKDENLIFKRATKNVCGGDLILMHPTYCTMLALPRILDYYEKNNIIATNVTTVIK